MPSTAPWVESAPCLFRALIRASASALRVSESVSSDTLPKALDGLHRVESQFYHRLSLHRTGCGRRFRCCRARPVRRPLGRPHRGHEECHLFRGEHSPSYGAGNVNAPSSCPVADGFTRLPYSPRGRAIVRAPRHQVEAPVVLFTTSHRAHKHRSRRLIPTHGHGHLVLAGVSGACRATFHGCGHELSHHPARAAAPNRVRSVAG